MSKSLLIVESPTKARTLSRYLGNDFIVKASVGHVKDLPRKTLGIDLEHGFQPEYQVIRGKSSVIKELKEAAGKADSIYLGPDPDREGEAIAWHIAESIQGAKSDKPVYRVLFHELTKKAIQEALAEPVLLRESPKSRHLYEAQQARRILDRLVGYLISPVLWDKVKRGLSAGRVQSVTLRLVCEREREIQRFVPVEYWTITGHFLAEAAPGGPPAKPFAAKLWQCEKKKCEIPSEEEASRLVKLLEPLAYVVGRVEKKKQRRNPAPPFITSTLQQEAARKLRFSAKRTMAVAQQLYEGIELGGEGAAGLVTYMRTDSTRLSDEAVNAAREHILAVWGKDYLPPKPVAYKTKKEAQDAHEAIRPTDVSRAPEKVAPFLNRDQLALYTLVWKRFVACQMNPAILDQTSVDIAGGDYVFRATGSVVRFPGFMILYVESEEDKESDGNGKKEGEKKEEELPDLKKGQVVTLEKLDPRQHFTQPPPRFSEASLIKELEEKGIGRPSTYATILSTLQEREYVLLVKRRLNPTELGFFINDLLVEHFPQIMNVEFTAQMESNLDDVEQGAHDHLRLVEEFYGPFSRSLQSAKENMRNLKRAGWPTDLKCPQCSRPLHIKWSRNGPFIACSGYPDCSFTSDYERDEKGSIQLLKREEEVTEEVCDKCGRPMVLKQGKYGRFLACSGYPECSNTADYRRTEEGRVRMVKREEEVTEEVCDKCGRPMVLKQGKYGRFLACSGYPKCKNTKPLSTGVPCPREGCDGELVERAGRKGKKFYGCSRYPKCRTVLRDLPVNKECPQCGSPVLVRKEDREGPLLKCPDSACSYSLRMDGEAAEEFPRSVEKKS